MQGRHGAKREALGIDPPRDRSGHRRLRPGTRSPVAAPAGALADLEPVPPAMAAQRETAGRHARSIDHIHMSQMSAKAPSRMKSARAARDMDRHDGPLSAARPQSPTHEPGRHDSVGNPQARARASSRRCRDRRPPRPRSILAARRWGASHIGIRYRSRLPTPPNHWRERIRARKQTARQAHRHTGRILVRGRDVDQLRRRTDSLGDIDARLGAWHRHEIRTRHPQQRSAAVRIAWLLHPGDGPIPTIRPQQDA